MQFGAGAEKIIERVRVKPGSKVSLKDYPSEWDGPEQFSVNGMELTKANSEKLLEMTRKELTKMQDMLWADNSHSALIILQGMDAAGKDGLIKHVMSGLNPQGCRVTPFRAPTHEELDHDFLWRCMKALPGRGEIGIFNRSYYEEVLIVKVNPSYLVPQRLPYEKFDRTFWEERYQSINDMERHLVRNGTLIIKFFLNISKKEQRIRLLERMGTPEKRWKFNPNDILEREKWNEYMEAYRQMLEATSTKYAPWYVLPADQKWLTRVLGALIITTQIASLDLKYPELPKEQLLAMEEMKRLLQKEKG
ncbi:MAG: polyphosphate kinase 2 family protein [Methanomassiliicoccales archaeon]